MTEMSRSRASKMLMALVAGLVLAVQSASAAEAHEYSVSMQNMAFGPIPSGLKVGDTIIWTNKDSVPHTVTSRDHSFDLRIGPGQSGRVTLTKAGSYQIYCVIHSPMRASFTVGG